MKRISLDCRALLCEDCANTDLLPNVSLDSLCKHLTEQTDTCLVLENADLLGSAGNLSPILLTILDACQINPGLALEYAFPGDISVRFASADDAPALVEIYAQYIQTAITFEYDLPSPEEFARRIQDITQVYPYLMLLQHGQPAGYAYAHRARERTAYDWVAELSIYLDKNAAGYGLGKRLYRLLMDLIAMQGLKTAMGCVTVPNPASEALHKSLGFIRVGLSPNAGYKNGAWHSVAWYEKTLAPYNCPPEPLIPLQKIDARRIAQRMGGF